MIVIFEKYQFLQKIYGLDPHGGCKNILGLVIFTIIQIWCVLLPFIILVTRFEDDIDYALATMPAIFGMGAVVPTYFQLVMKRKRIHMLLDEVQDIVDRSM